MCAVCQCQQSSLTLATTARENIMANVTATFTKNSVSKCNYRGNVLGKLALPGPTEGAYNTELQNLYSGNSH